MLDKIFSNCVKALKVGCAVYCTLHYVASPVVCIGASMEPTINSGDIVFALQSPLVVNRTALELGDIVIAKSPENPQQLICKRIVAVEGDSMKTRNSWLHSRLVPKRHVWLEGDNKSNSTDSRDYGPVPLNLITCRVVFKIWPLYDFGPLSRNQS